MSHGGSDASPPVEVDAEHRREHSVGASSAACEIDVNAQAVKRCGCAAGSDGSCSRSAERQHHHDVTELSPDGKGSELNEEEDVDTNDDVDSVTVEPVSVVSAHSSAAKKKSSSAASTMSPAAQTEQACQDKAVEDVEADSDKDDARADVGSCCAQELYSASPSPPLSHEATTSLLRGTTLLNAGGLPDYFYSAFTATHEHLRDRFSEAFYTDALFSGPGAFPFGEERDAEEGRGRPTTCDEGTEEGTNEGEEGGGAGERGRLSRRGTCRTDCEKDASAASLHRSNGSRTGMRERQPSPVGGGQNASVAAASPTAASRLLLDPMSTSFFKRTHASAWSSWVGKGEHFGEEEEEERKGSTSADSAPVADEDGLWRFEAGSRTREWTDGDVKTLVGDGAVADVFRRAIQAVYDHEDALEKSFREEEDRLLQRRLRLLNGPAPGAHSARGASSSSPAARQQQPRRPVDVFVDDFTPAHGLPMSNVTPSVLNKGQQQQPANREGRLRLVRTTAPSSAGPAGAEEVMAFRKSQRASLMQQMRRRAEARAAKDQRTLLHRLQEHPCLVEDGLRYACVLARLRAGRGAGDTHRVGGSGPTEEPSSPSSATPTTTATPTANVSASSLASGDAGQLLYLKYPPPFFRTTSFTAETVRLLKWLRTWRHAEPPKPSRADATPPQSLATPRMPPAQTRKGRAKASSPPQPLLFAAERMASVTATLTRCLDDTLAADAAPKKAAAKQRSAPAVKSASVSAKQQTPLTAFFGAAAVTATAAQELNVDGEKKGGAHLQTVRGGPSKRGRSAVAKNDNNKNGNGKGDVEFDSPAKAAKTEGKPGAAPFTSSAPPPPLPPPAVSQVPADPVAEALQTYCAGWRDAVRSTAHSSTPSPLPPRGTPQLPTAAATHRPAAPRAVTSLPFYNDMLKETDVLGSVAEVHYDRHGTRLRSARLAKKEAETREKEERQRLLLETKKGYFTRNSAEREGGPSSDTDTSDSDSDEAGQDDITNIAVVSGPTGSGKTAAVYLAAHLLQFRVVEMNAAVRRCPKNVERLLAELTRSHRLSGLSRGRALVSVEEELQKLKREHAALVAKMQAEADIAAQAAAAEEAARKARKTPKANAISAQAVAAFFGAKPKSSASGSSDSGRRRAAAHSVEDAVAEQGERAPAASAAAVGALSPSPPSPVVEVVEDDEKKPLQPSPASPSEASRTLLLLEDADVLLGDESMKPFYAAIRDLAQRSNVPLVVTVSSPADAEGRRYGNAAHRLPTAPSHIVVEPQQPPSGGRHGCPLSAGHVEGDAMAAMAEARMRLCEEERVPEANAFHHVALNARLTARFFGRRTPFTRVDALSRAALYAQLLIVAAVERGLLQAVPGSEEARDALPLGRPPSALLSDITGGSTTSTIESIVHGAMTAPHQLLPPQRATDAGSDADSVTISDGEGGGCRRGRGATSTAVSLNLKADRSRRSAAGRGRVQLGARGRGRGLARGGRGRGAKTFTLLDNGHSDSDSMPSSTTVTTASSSSSSSASNSRASGTNLTGGTGDVDEFSHCAGAAAEAQIFTLRIVNVTAFQHLADVLRKELFQQPAWAPTRDRRDSAEEGEEEEGGCDGHAVPLPIMSTVKAASLATTDARYWLNHLQLLMLGHTLAKSPDDAAPLQRSPPQQHTAPQPTHLTCEGLSCADVFYGRYRQSLAHNDLHCPRQQFWQLDATVSYGDDILRELETVNHPTSTVDYSPKQTPTSCNGAVVDVDSGKADDGEQRRKRVTKRGRGEAKKPPTPPPQPRALPAIPVSASQPPVAPAKPTIASFFHVASPSGGPVALPLSNPNPTATAEPSALTNAGNSASSSSLSLWQYCREVLQTEAWRWPSEAVLPYGDAQRWLTALDAEEMSFTQAPAAAAAASSHSGTEFAALPRQPVSYTVRGLVPPLSIAGQSTATTAAAAAATNAMAATMNASGAGHSSSGSGAGTSAHGGSHLISGSASSGGGAMAGHTASSPALTNAGLSNSAGGSSGGGGGSLAASPVAPGGVRALTRVQTGPQQAWWGGTSERMAAFRAVWRRTRKTDNLKQFVVARSPSVVEDVLGFSALTGPTPSGGAKDVTLL